MTSDQAAPAVPERVTPPFGRDRMVHGWLALKGLSDAGDAAWTVALAWTAVQVASPTIAGLVVAAGTIPRALALLFGGAVADRFDTRGVMIATNLVRIAVLAATATISTTAGDSVTLLVTVAAAFGVCDALFEPAAGTLGRQLVDEPDLAAYTSGSQTGSRLGYMAGAALGGGLVATAGLAGAALANLGTYAVVVFYLTAVLRVRIPIARAEEEPVLRAIASGFGHLRGEPTARTLVLALSGLNLAVGPAIALGIALRVQDEEWGAGTLGVLQALVGLGALCGALVLFRWRPARPARLAFGMLVAQGVGIVALAVPLLPVALVATTVIGVTAGVASALLGAVFVRAVASGYLGRLGSILRLGDDVLMPGAMALFGAVAAGASLEVGFVLYGGAMAALMLVTVTRPGVRALDRA
ncbi:MAG TPA: MFS transporter [Nocardioides sp.]|nr:MFS transporter [Nocardioides sp.]